MRNPQALRLSAWLPHPSPSGLSSFAAHAPKLSRLYPLWYRLGDEGLGARHLRLSPAERHQVAETAKANEVEIWPQVAPENPGQYRRMLMDAKCRAFHIQSLIATALEDGVQGLMLNYGPVWDEERPAFKIFLAQLHEACVNAKLKIGLVLSAENLDGLGDEADLVHCKLIGFHSASTPAGVIAPITWIAAGLKSALALVQAEKLELGFPGYGMHWQAAGASILDYAAWDALVAAQGPAQRDTDSGELLLKAPGHEAWYCDSIASLRKLLQAREAGINQAALWGLGSEDPRLWEMLDDFPVPFVAARA
jgi:spore germination protein YaaH